MSTSPSSDACLTAHGAPGEAPTGRSLVLVYAGELSRHLLAMAEACGYRCSVVEPDPDLAEVATGWAATVVKEPAGVDTDPDTDVVVTDHHRADLGTVLAAFLDRPTRWIGIIGNPRDPGPHIGLLTELGYPAEKIALVHRPIGLNIGSRTPAEIAVSILGSLLADRSGRPGGFDRSTRL